MDSHKKDRVPNFIKQNNTNEVIHTACALLNSKVGGQITVRFHEENSHKVIDDWIRGFEQRLEEILGIFTYLSNVNLKVNGCEVVIPIRKTSKPVTIDYNLYLPTVSQVVAVPPTTTAEQIRDDILQRQVVGDEMTLIGSHEKGFVKGKSPGLNESRVVQFKNLKDKASKCVTLADRIVQKSNRLTSCISAFANDKGGHIYYGINDHGIVEGEEINKEKERLVIVKKVAKALNKMVWFVKNGNPRKGEHWDIFFEQVRDNLGNLIRSTFVIVIYVAACPDGVFTEEPESYHLVNGAVTRMPFAVWWSRLFGQSHSSRSAHGVEPGRSYASERENSFGLVGWQFEYTVTSEQHVQTGNSEEADSEWTNAALGASNDTPSSVLGSTVSRARWSSEKKQKVYHQLSEKLVKYRNDSSEAEFEVFARMAEGSFPQYDAHLIVLAERIAYAYRTGHYRKAQSLLHEYETSLSSSSSADISIFRFKAVCAKSAIARTQGQYEESHSIAVEGLQLAQLIPAGIATAWFYSHLAALEVVLSQTGKEESTNDMLKKADRHYITALQHAEASSVEQEFFTSLADLRQLVHIHRAIMLSGHCVSGDQRALGARSCDIKSAKEALGVLHHISLDGYSKTWFREIQYYLALCDLGVCQWWQLMQQQQLEQRRQQQQRQQQRRHQSQSSDKILDPLMVAFGYSKKAVKLAKDCRFEEMASYAEKRVAVLTETILRHKVSQLNLPRNTVGNTVD